MIHIMKAALVGIFFFLLMPVALSGEDKKFGDWRYKAKTDDLDDSQAHLAETFALAGGKGRFAVGCAKPGGVLSVMYATDKNMGRDGEMREVTYSVDENPPVKQQWKTLRTGIFNTKPIEARAMVDALIGGHELVIQTDDPDGNRVRRTFSLDGAGDAIARVLKNCPATLSEGVKSFGDWLYKIKTVNNSQAHRALTFARTGEKGIFIVGCAKLRGVLSVAYGAGKNMGKKGEMREVTYRVDKNPPVKQQWHSFQTGIYNGKPIEAHAMANALIGGDELIIQTDDSDGNRVRRTFSLDGAGDAIARALKHCPATLSGDWLYKIKTDELDDSQTHSAVTSARTGEKGTFIVLCEKPRGVLSVLYQTDKNMGKDGEMREVTYRVDKNPPVKQQWDKVQTGIYNTKPIEARAMVDALIRGHKLIIRTYDSDYNRVQSTFSLDGAGDAVARVLKHCKA